MQKFNYRSCFSRFLRSMLIVFLLASTNVVVSRENPDKKSGPKVVEIDPASISKHLADGDGRLKALMKKYKIKDMRELDAIADEDASNKFNEELSLIRDEVANAGSSEFSKEGALFTNRKGCAFLVTDMEVSPPEEGFEDEGESDSEEEKLPCR